MKQSIVNAELDQEARVNPVKAIRKKCLECSGGSSREVERCQIKDCALYPFRFGRNPFRAKRELTDEQKAEMAERLRKARDKRQSAE